MKKMIIILIALFFVFYVYSNSKKEEVVKIPDSAIRFRILANSNSTYDQNVKETVRDEVQEEIYTLLKDTNNINNARNLIKSNIPNFEKIVSNELKDEAYSYKIDYGMHYFPEKEYKGIIYEEGTYESLLVTLGEGKGDNWWCVLFPPLCVLEAEENVEKDKIVYKFYVKEILEKYFN